MASVIAILLYLLGQFAAGGSLSGAGPSIQSLSITTGAVGATVTITGQSLGATQGASTVKFNGTAATATSWSQVQIIVTVPAGATTGNVVVHVGSTDTNGIAFTVTGGSVANPIDTARRTDWSNAGVEGGIPSGSWTQCGSTIAAGASTATIQAAITACTANHYVLLGAGAFSITGLNMKTGVVLRGNGANSTFVTSTGDVSCAGAFASICFGDGDSNQYFGATQMQPGQSHAASWDSGYARGSTSIVLSAIGSNGIAVGQYLMLDQANATAPATGYVICGTKPTCSIDGGDGDPGRIVSAVGRQQIEIVKVTACSPSCTSGSTFTITPALRSPNWVSGKTPGAWWPNSSNVITNSGIEDLSLDASTSGNHANINFYNAANCWVRGLRLVRNITSGSGNQFIIALTPAWHVTIQDSYFYGTQGQSINYGVMNYISSDNLVLNNIFQHTVVPIMEHTSVANVFAYNYTINDTYDDGTLHQLATCIAGHSAGVQYNLYEGNICPGLGFDGFHGNQTMNTSFRNYWLGSDPGRTDGRNAIFEDPYNRYQNFVGNVLGTLGTQTGYTNTGVAVYSLGNSRSTLPSDSEVLTTLFRWGNWDVITNTTRWCGNASSTGWATTCSSTSEVPTGLSDYPNAVPATETLPNSMYYSATPSWWPSGKAWPLIGPDVTGGTIANVGGHVYPNPAKDCYLNVMGGPVDGTGAVLTFNRTTCYP